MARPKSGKALSPAEKQRRYRARLAAKAAAKAAKAAEAQAAESLDIYRMAAKDLARFIWDRRGRRVALAVRTTISKLAQAEDDAKANAQAKLREAARKAEFKRPMGSRRGLARPVLTSLAGFLVWAAGRPPPTRSTAPTEPRRRSCTLTKAVVVTVTRWLPCKLHGTHCCEHSSDRGRAAARPFSLNAAAPRAAGGAQGRGVATRAVSGTVTHRLRHARVRPSWTRPASPPARAAPAADLAGQPLRVPNQSKLLAGHATQTWRTANRRTRKPRAPQSARRLQQGRSGGPLCAGEDAAAGLPPRPQASGSCYAGRTRPPGLSGCCWRSTVAILRARPAHGGKFQGSLLLAPHGRFLPMLSLRHCAAALAAPSDAIVHRVCHNGNVPGGVEAKAFMAELIEGQTVVCDLTQERTHGDESVGADGDGKDVAEALIRAGLPPWASCVAAPVAA